MSAPYSRRDFLKTAAAATTLAALPAAAWSRTAPGPGVLTLTAGLVEQALAAGAAPVGFWGFNGTVPGPTLRLRRGERLRVAFRNQLPAASAVHWHGIRVPNAMDGVPYVTQDPVPPGGEFAYEFTVPDSGTFWYHPHQSSFEQVPRGLYGALIVEEEKPLQVDREVVWLLSDVKLGADGQQVEDFGRILDLANEGRLGNQVLVNGQAAGAGQLLPVRSGERLRLRLINGASARIFNLVFAGHGVTAIAFDGQAVTPHPLEQVRLGPGMRVDLVIDCLHAGGASFPVTDAGHRGSGELARIVYRQDKALRGKPLGGSLQLAANRLPEPDPAKATDHYIVFQGGMRGAPVIGTIDGKPSKIQDLMEKHGLAWTMNYTAEHEHALMHEPLLHLKRGEHVHLRMINETDYPHPMHLHGHFFRVVAIDGQPARFREWRDTVLMGPRQTIDVAFVADNPGEWMYHCHILDHAAGGMMGTLAVE
jgi:FtsP/CotA-like multicopper oxidase with cupredoxin domain